MFTALKCANYGFNYTVNNVARRTANSKTAPGPTSVLVPRRDIGGTDSRYSAAIKRTNASGMHDTGLFLCSGFREMGAVPVGIML